MNKAVVTGIGLVTSAGIGKESFFNSIQEGKSGISKITLFDTSRYFCKEAGQVKDITDTSDRAYTFLKKATDEALIDADIEKTSLANGNAKLFTGTTHGSLIDWENWYRKIDPPDSWGLALEDLSIRCQRALGLKNRGLTISTACTSSTIALGLGLLAIRNNKADISIVGGVDVLNEFIFAGFHSLRALTTTCCKPFDKSRDGLILGEGAAVLVIENLDYAKKRNAKIYCELKGFSACSDARHFTAPDLTGEGIYRCIKNGLQDADVKVEEVSYINAHGTGTELNDRAECIAIKKLFGKYAFSVPVSSTKPILGHTSGACGVIEAALCALCIERCFIPPTINFEFPEKDFPFDFVPRKGRKKFLDVAISTNAAFGGNNACIVLKRI